MTSISEYLATLPVAPGPVFGRVLMEEDCYAVDGAGQLYVHQSEPYQAEEYVLAERRTKKRLIELAGASWSLHIQSEVMDWLKTAAPALANVQEAVAS